MYSVFLIAIIATLKGLAGRNNLASDCERKNKYTTIARIQTLLLLSNVSIEC